MRKTILAVLAALMLSGGIAHADADDHDFLRALHQQGIKDAGGDPAMIKLGRTICDLRADGYSENALMGMGKLHGDSMSDQTTIPKTGNPGEIVTLRSVLFRARGATEEPES